MKNYALAVMTADKNNLIDSFNKAIDFLEKDENNVLNAFYAGDYCYIKHNAPETFEKIKAFVAKDRLQPLGAWWCNSENKKMSDEAVIRNVLFSQKFFMKNFGKTFRTGYGKKINNPLAPMMIYGAKMNAYVCEDKSNYETCFWWDSKSVSRIMAVDSSNIPLINSDSIADDKKLITLDEYFCGIYMSMTDFEDISLDESGSEIESGCEKLLLKAEKINTVASFLGKCENKTKELTKAWKNHLCGNDEIAEKSANEIIDEAENCGCGDDCIIEIDNENVELLCLKYCADKSGNVLIRIRETAGKSRKTIVKCDLFDCAFYVDIEPYEIRNFSIDKDGFATETNFIENIDK